MESASRRTPQNALPPSALAGRLQPEPTGSIRTRSVKASQVSGLSCNLVSEPVLPRQGELGNARSNKAEIEERRGRSRSAVEHEGQRTVRAGAFGDKGGVIDRSRALARLIVERKRSGRRRIVELAARDFDRVLGDRI